jgi:acyl-CoA thioesterase II
MELANLRDCLNLRRVGEGRFEGDNYKLDYHRVFGGQILAQAITALATVADGMTLKSLTQVFSREGSAAEPMTYGVDERHRGRTFATYSIAAQQGERTVGSGLATLHRPDEGYERQDPAPQAGSPADAREEHNDLVPWEVRVVGGKDLGSRDARPATYAFWMRAQTGEGDQWLQQALLAHATDLTVIGTGLLPVDGLSQADTGTRIHTAVTSHTLWFHQPFALDDWVLVDQHSPILTAGRCFGRGDVWTRDGRLVASFAQEALVRPIPES